MLLFLWLLLSLMGACLLLLPLALWLREVYRQYSGARGVTCPENQQPAAVSLDARHAIATGIDGRPILRLCDCTRWPEHANCNRACLPHAVRAEANRPATGKPAAKPIYHLPVVLAAFAGWYLGAVWHSQYVFRAQWLNSLGLTQADAIQMVWWLSPHLLTLAACVLFAYGVAWLLALRHRKGVLQGLWMSGLLCAAVVAASWYQVSRLPRTVIAIEAGYAVLACLLVGTIVGGLYDKLRLRPE